MTARSTAEAILNTTEGVAVAVTAMLSLALTFCMIAAEAVAVTATDTLAAALTTITHDAATEAAPVTLAAAFCIRAALAVAVTARLALPHRLQ